jgi:hypothetical protein
MPAYTWTDAALATSLPPTAILATSFLIPVGAIACRNLVVDIALERTMGVNQRDPSFVSMWLWRGVTVLDGSVPFNITSPPLVWQGNMTPPTSMLIAPGGGITRTHRFTLPALPTALLSSITYWLGVSVGTARGYHLSTRTFNAWRWRTTIDNVSTITTSPYKAIDRFGTAGALQYPALINWTTASMAEVWVSSPSGMISLTHQLAGTVYANCTGPTNQSAPNVLPNGTFPPVFAEASSSSSATSSPVSQAPLPAPTPTVGVVVVSPSFAPSPPPLPPSAGVPVSDGGGPSLASNPSPTPTPQPMVVLVKSPSPSPSPVPTPVTQQQQGIPSPLFVPTPSKSIPIPSSSSSSAIVVEDTGSVTLSRSMTIGLGLGLGIGLLCIAAAVIVCVANRKLMALAMYRLQINRFNQKHDILINDESNTAISLESMEDAANGDDDDSHSVQQEEEAAPVTGRTSEDADSLEEFKDAPNISSTIAAFPSPPSSIMADDVSDDDNEDDLERRRMQTVPLSYTSTGAPKLSPSATSKKKKQQQQQEKTRGKRKGEANNEGGGGIGKK